MYKSHTRKFGNLFLIPVIILGLLLGAGVFVFRALPVFPVRAATTADFKVQRGCKTPSGGTTGVTLTAGTDYTAPTINGTSSAFIRLVSTRGSGMGSTGGGTPQEANDWTWYISDPDFTDGSVAFTRAGTTNAQRFCWEIIEYIGTAGDQNEIKVRSVGKVTYTASGLTVDGSSVSVTSSSSVVVFITGQDSVESGTQQEVAAGQSTSDWIAASNIPRFTRGTVGGGGGDANHLSYAVVEFTGSNWVVQRKQHQFGAAGSTETETITDVGTTSRAFFHAQFRRGDLGGTDDGGAEMWLSANNKASFLLESTAESPTGKYAVIWIVRNTYTGSATAMNVQHKNGTRNTASSSEGVSGEDEWTNTITTVGDISQTSIMGESGRDAGTTNAYPHGWISLRLYTATSVKLYHSDDVTQQNYRFQVVEWPKKSSILTQSGYRFFNNNDGTNVGASLAALNSPATLSDAGAAFRLRTLLHVGNADFEQSDRNFILQLAKQSGTCDTAFSGEVYYNVTNGTPIAYKNNAIPADGATLTATTSDPTHGGDTNVLQTYEEQNTFTNSLATIPVGRDGLWDFSLVDNNAPTSTTYCFRVVNAFNWDLSNASYDNVSSSFSNVAERQDMTFSNDGTKMYIVPDTSVVYQYSLSAPWDIVNKSYDGSYSGFNVDIGGSADPADIFFKNDGRKMYVLDEGYKKIYQYSLGVSWDITTASFDNVSSSIPEFDTPSETPYALAFNNTGTKLYVADFAFTSYIYQYSLTNWDLATITYDHVRLYFNEGKPQDITFNNGGTKMYVSGGAKPGTVDLSSAVPSWRNWLWPSFSFTKVLDKIRSLFPKANAFGGSGTGVTQYSLGTAWELSSAIYDNLKLDTSQQFSITEGAALNGDGSKLYLLGYGGVAGAEYQAVYQYSLYTPSDSPQSILLNAYNIVPQITTASLATFSDLIQKNYRWYSNVNTKDPGNNQSIAAENIKMVNLATGRNRHLRLSVESPNGDFASGQIFKFQYQKSTTTGSWTDVGTGAFTGADFSCCTDGTTTTALRLSSSSVLQTYEEDNGANDHLSTSTPNTINRGKVAEWDWALHSETTAQLSATYYFRMLGSNGTAFASYQNYPSLSISATGSTSIGEVTSVIYNTGNASGTQLNSFFWEGSRETGDAVEFQFASANCSNGATNSPTCNTGTWQYLGPLGTSVTWYIPSGPGVSNTITPGNHKNHQYFRYKIRLESSSGISPVVNHVVINWSP